MPQFAITTIHNCVCLSLLDHMSACTQVIYLARLNLCALHMWLRTVYRPDLCSLDRLVHLPPSELALVGVPTQCVPKGPLHCPTKSLITDVFLLGQNRRPDSISTCWIFGPSTTRLAFLYRLRHSLVHMLMDNTTVKYYVNK